MCGQSWKLSSFLNCIKLPPGRETDCVCDMKEEWIARKLLINYKKKYKIGYYDPSTLPLINFYSHRVKKKGIIVSINLSTDCNMKKYILIKTQCSAMVELNRGVDMFNRQRR